MGAHSAQADGGVRFHRGLRVPRGGDSGGGDVGRGRAPGRGHRGAGRGFLDLGQAGGFAGVDQTAAVAAAAGPQVDHVIGDCDQIGIVLGHHDGVAGFDQFFQGAQQ